MQSKCADGPLEVGKEADSTKGSFLEECEGAVKSVFDDEVDP